MAYRKLFGVAVMTFSVVAACGGGEGRTALDAPGDDGLPFADADQASGNPDQPETNPDQPERNPDQPQLNPDQPPASVPGGSGGGLESVCHAVCDVFDACEIRGSGLGILRDICSRSCTVPRGEIPCPTELGQYLSCLSASTTLCVAEQGAPGAEECTGAGQAFGRCVDDADYDPGPLGN